MLRKYRMIFLPVILCTGIAISCKKYKDNPGPTDPRLDRPYCNDPQAVNYNWGFPGKPDNSICLYPTDLFTGSYDYYDSIYDGSNKLVGQVTTTLSMTAMDHTKMRISGFCGSSAYSFTANRQFRAEGDSILAGGAQLFCRPVDTLSGYIFKDSVVGQTVHFNLTVASDTGVYYHRGSAIKK